LPFFLNSSFQSELFLQKKKKLSFLDFIVNINMSKVLFEIGLSLPPDILYSLQQKVKSFSF